MKERHEFVYRGSFEQYLPPIIKDVDAVEPDGGEIDARQTLYALGLSVHVMPHEEDERTNTAQYTTLVECLERFLPLPTFGMKAILYLS